MQISDVCAAVTGGASGLGEATVRQIVTQGGRAAILDMNAEKGEALAKELGDSCFFARTNVADEAAVTHALDQAVERFGRLNANVNCAGIGSAGRTVSRDGTPFSLETFRLTVEVNLIGTFNAIRLAAARMLKHEPDAAGERGVIINTASVAAFDGQIGQCAYSASKGGVVGMTLPIARDLAKSGIRVNTIAPGLFATPMLMMMPEPARQALAATIPFPPRLGDPPEYAALACHIIENGMLNGETIRLDGAVRMPPK
ncbi:MAG: 3-hydroxyacyl-CoA dehydrogenase [Proteobacteria bacterium]|nr:3-hydroxyacyl-CoA dehydrogenase [Pseudomonadota bacterium]